MSHDQPIDARTISLSQIKVTDLGGENLGSYMKVTDAGVTTNCYQDYVTSEIICDEEYSDVALFRLTEGVLNTAIIVPIDSKGEQLD